MKTFLAEYNATQRAELRFVLASALAAMCVFILVTTNLAFAQVTKPGSKEERETDAKALSATTSEKPATPADRGLLEVQLQALIDAYERGDVGFFQAKIDPAMPGYSRVLDAMRRDATSQTRPRLLFTDQTWTIGPNVAMLQARFQKRYFDARNLAPELVEGRVVMLLARDGDLWRLNTITGDNPFESRVLAPCSTGVVRLLSPPNANSEPFFVEIDDADLAGVASIQADIVTSRGDRELLTLPSISPDGKFRVRVNAQRLTAQGASVPNDGVIQLVGDVLVTARYADQCVAISRAQQVVSASDTRRDPGVLGQLACRAGGNLTFVSLATSSANAPTNAPITLELVDPDLAGLVSINVTIRAGNDVETITLGAIGNLGRFLSTSLPVRAGTAVVATPNNGTLEISGATTLAAEYIDQRPGVVGSTVRVAADCGSIPSGYQTAQLTCSINSSLNDLANFPSRAVPAQISLVDPDLAIANPAFVNATLRNSLGDAETIRLDQQGPGRYGASSANLGGARGTSGDGVLNFPSTGSILLDYVDPTTASGGSQTLSQTCGQVTPGFTLASLSISFPGINGNTIAPIIGIRTERTLPCSIVLTDPDLSSASVTVQLTATRATGGTDVENIVLPRTSPGVYSISSCRYDGYQSVAAALLVTQPVPGNDVINLGGGTTTISVVYADPTTPSGSTQIVQRSATVSN